MRTGTFSEVNMKEIIPYQNPADPVLNSRYLLYEAQQAHYYGLSSNLALAAVTSTPAETLGMEHRIGFLKPGSYHISRLFYKFP